MVKEIVTYPTPPSTEYSTDVRVFDENIVSLIDNMKETIEANNLDALTAFQIGNQFNVVVIKEDNGSYLELINPRLFSTKGQVTTEEKTAYFPGLSAKVTRHESVSVVYQDREGNDLSLKATGDRSILLQRKIDYTFGSTYLQKLDKDEKARFELKLEYGSNIAVSESCPTVFQRDKLLKVINVAMIAMVILLFISFFVSDENALVTMWSYQAYTALAVLILNIIYFFYAQYEGKKYTSCTSCQIGNIIGTTVISLFKLTLLFLASYLLI
ncbi:MAG: peptide deformylase [Helicobacteraceae bacterium]|nr:peptide deformylase [Helicobacteraceae bacterium]